MIDFHSHFLPGIDDGSENVSMSLSMRNNPERFLRNREAAYNAVRDAMSRYRPSNGGNWPDIMLGAEVYFFNGISRYEGLHDLCLEGTDLLLLEMPFTPWTSRMIDEVSIIASTTGIMPVAAHIERYLNQPKSLVKAFLDLDIYIQSNAEFFLERGTDRVVFNEINTIPGSLAFYLWEPLGVPYKELLDRMIGLALKRVRTEQSITFSFDTNILNTAGAGGLKGAKVR